MKNLKTFFFFSNIIFRSSTISIGNVNRSNINKHQHFNTRMNYFLKIIGCISILVCIGELCLGKSESRLRIGKALNVFVRYGYLGISMKVISYNDTEKWLFKEPTNNVFKVNNNI